MIGRLIIFCLLFPLNVVAQEFDTVDVVSHKEAAHTSVMNRIRQLQHYLDSTAMSKVDPRYIEVPAKPWRVMARYKENAVEVDYENGIDFPETHEYSEWKLRFSPPRASSVGFWVGYRGTGVGYSFSLNKNAGRYFTFSSTGAKYGFKFRLRRFSISETTLTGTDYKDGNFNGDYSIEGQTYAPVWIRSVYVNGYYVLNGRRYSQAAAYNQSVIQRRSSGSFLLGVTWNQSSFDYSDNQNAIFMLGSHNIGHIKMHQANIGIGYGYNLVPFRGMVVNLMLMPNVSVYNRVKVYKYDCNYELTRAADTSDYGQWNPQTHTWANGKTHKPFPANENDMSWLNDIDIWKTGSETDYGMLRFSLDMRLGIAYNWKNFFLALQLQYNQLSYKKSNSKVSLLDGFGQVNLGVRL